MEIDASSTEALSGEVTVLERLLESLPGLQRYSWHEGEERERIFSLRRAALGALMGMRGGQQAVTGMEDAAVPLSKLSTFYREFRDAARAQGVDLISYGSVGAGLIQFRPLLDLRRSTNRDVFRALQLEQASIVSRLGGSISAKHADGRIRAGLLSSLYSPLIMGLFRDLKKMLDPDGLFNPGKILSPKELLTDLRATEPAADAENSGFRWGPYGLNDALARCQGAAVCRAGADFGSMCPTFPVLDKESGSTRGRANLLRQAFNDPAGICDGELLDALRSCVACKACKSECPAGVDMARLKSEALHRKYLRAGSDFADRIIAALPSVLAMSSRVPRLANRLSRANLVKDILKIDTRRSLPLLKRYTLDANGRGVASSGNPLLLLLDPYSAFLHPENVRFAVEVLRKLNFPSKRFALGERGAFGDFLGHLERARRELRTSLRRLRPWLRNDLPVVSLEPSEALTFRDEAPDLLDAELLSALSERVRLLDEFLLERLPEREQSPTWYRDHPVLVHTHCHQKSLQGEGSVSGLLRRVGFRNVQDIAAGCCGMAGFFGLRRGNYELSQALAERSLFPRLRQAPPGTSIVANGYSCREQIRSAGFAHAMHVVELLYGVLCEPSAINAPS